MNTRPWDTPYPSRISPTLIRKWVKSYPTPFYVYDYRTLVKRAREVRMFPHPRWSRFTPRYAIKANSNISLIRILATCGIDFDASSEYEVERLLRGGISPNRIILTSQQIPHPEVLYFEQLFRQGLIYNATSLRQLEWYGGLSSDSPLPPLSLRINPGFGSGMHHKTTVGGLDSGFGIWHEYYPEILSLVQKHRLVVDRLHIHVGSGSDPQAWGEVTQTCLELLRHFPSVQTINIGGGFKVARHSGETSANLKSIGMEVKARMEAFAQKEKRRVHLEIEPGTYYLAEAGLLIAQVEDVISTGKKDRRHFIKLNCGMNDLIRPTLYHSHHHVDIIPLRPAPSHSPSAQKKPKPYPYTVIGHCCESGDQISQHIHPSNSLEQGGPKATSLFHPPQPGDAVIIHGAGAYGSSMASRYNSYPLCAEYLYQPHQEEKFRVIRRGESIDDILAQESGCFK